MRITLHTFRRVARTEEAMMRAVMPKAHANSPEALEAYGYQHTTVRTARTLTSTRPLTATMQEMTR